MLYALNVLAVAYPKWAREMATASQDGPEVWSRLLEDVDPKRLIAAAIRHAKSSKWPPTVADLRAGVDRQPEPVLTQGEAFKAARELAQHGTEIGRYFLKGQPPEVLRAAALAFDAVGGKTAFLELPADEVGFMRQRFEKHYAHALAMIQRDALMEAEIAAVGDVAVRALIEDAKIAATDALMDGQYARDGQDSEDVDGLGADV